VQRCLAGTNQELAHQRRRAGEAVEQGSHEELQRILAEPVQLADPAGRGEGEPSAQAGKINVGPFDPYVLTIEECRKVLNLCREKHLEVLPLLALNLFCGIRPSETRRLSSSKGRDGNFDWEDNEVVFQAKKTKTKMRRFVEMSENCLAWLGVQELNLPIVNANHKWDTFLRDARKALGYKTWPHDCIRHSFCSYGLRHAENAGKVALQAGNTEKVLFEHYLKLVSKSAAKEFWSIAPGDEGTQFEEVAA